MSNKITFITGDEMLLDDIGELWEKLRRHHLEKSSDFRQHFKDTTFKERKEVLMNKAKAGKMFIVIACDGEDKIGYCVSSVVNKVGEIESIYVNPNYRKYRLGSTLMEKSLEWIKAKGIEKIILTVAAGNEEAFGFYSKFGFVPKQTELQLVPEDIENAN